MEKIDHAFICIKSFDKLQEFNALVLLSFEAKCG